MLWALLLLTEASLSGVGGNDGSGIAGGEGRRKKNPVGGAAVECCSERFLFFFSSRGRLLCLRRRVTVSGG